MRSPHSTPSRPSRPLLAALLSILILTACERSATEPGPASFTGTWGGQSWNGAASASFYPTEQDTVIITGVRYLGAMPDNYISIQVPFDGPGVYEVRPSSAQFSYLVGGDVLVGTYGIPEGSVGELVIEERTSTHIRGTVDLPMVSTGGVAPRGPQARFQGTFDALIVTGT